MNNPGFGHKWLNEHSDIDKVMATSPLLDSFSASLLLRETYEQVFNIYDHGNRSYENPLSLVAMHSRENTCEGSPLYRSIRRYREAGVKEAFGLSLTEFLALPREYTSLIFTILAEEAESSTSKIDKDIKDLEKRGW